MPRKRPKILKMMTVEEMRAPPRRRPTRGRRRPHPQPPVISDRDCAVIEGAHGDVLGAGSFGIVYKKRYGDRDVAVKVAKEEFDINEAVLNYAASEVADGVAKVVGMCPKEKLFLVEALKGRALRTDADASPRKVMEVAEQLFTTLYHMHSAGIYHGDVSENNVLYDGTDAKFIDFGFACDTDDTCEAVEQLGQGVPAFHPPEWAFRSLPLADAWGQDRREAEEECHEGAEENLRECLASISKSYGAMKHFIPSAEKRMAAKDVWSVGLLLSMYANLDVFDGVSGAERYADRAELLQKKASFPTRDEVGWALVWPPSDDAPAVMVNPRADGPWPKVVNVIKHAMNPNPMLRPTAEEMLNMIDAVKWY